MLQRDHDIGLKGFNESRLKFYHREAILLIRSPFECIFHNYIFLSKSRIKEGYILKNLFIENKGNKQTNNSFSIINSQLLVFNFT